MNDSQKTQKNDNNGAISKGAIVAKMSSLFMFTYLGALIFGIVAHRDIITWKASEMIALYIAAPAAAVMLWLLLMSRKDTITLKAVFGVLCGIAGIAVSIAVLVMEWETSKAVVMYTAVPATFVVIVWLVMRRNTKGKVMGFLKIILKAPIRIFVIKTEAGAPALGSYSDFLFLTWMVLAGFLLGPIIDAGWLSPNTCALIWILTGIYAVCALNNSMSKHVIGFLIALAIVLPLGNFFLLRTQDINILGEIKDYYVELDISYEGNLRNFAFVWSVVWAFIIICSIIWTRLNKMHWVQSETIRRFYIIGGTETAVANTKNADSRYPNLFKALFFLMGDVVVNNPENKIEWYRIRNVWFLPFRIRKIRNALRTSDVREIGKD